VDILWFDCLDSPQYLWKNVPEESVRLVRKLQPGIMINDRCGLRGDFDTPEQRIGGFERERPWETCATIASGWSWRPNTKPKSLKQCIQLLVNTAGRDGNLLLNVAPKADGTFEPDQVARLKEISAWLKTNGQSIYGTRGGPFLPDKGFVSTCKGNTIYLHLLNGRTNLVLPELKAEVTSIRLLNGGPVTTEKKTGEQIIGIDKANIDKTDAIVVMTLSQSAESMEPKSIF